jgi:hypothetical protein
VVKHSKIPKLPTCDGQSLVKSMSTSGRASPLSTMTSGFWREVKMLAKESAEENLSL